MEKDDELKQDPEQDPDEYDDDENETPATPDEMKAEAIKRLRALDIYPETIEQFKNDGLVSISEPPLYAHYWADTDLQKVIKDFENEYGGLVYYGIYTIYEEIGEMYALFYVSQYKSEWPLDWDDMDAGTACVYVYNKSEPLFSEIGSIGYEHTPAGSLRRTM